MAATIVIKGCTGTDAGNEATITSIMYRANDSTDTDKTNPIVIPDSGTSYSYEKWIRWECTVAPDTQCTNFRFWGPNTAPATGLLVYAGTTDTGVTPVTTESTVASTRQDTNYTAIGSSLSVSGTLTTIGHQTDYVVLQLRVADTAAQGDMPQQTYNYAYDEN